MTLKVFQSIYIFHFNNLIARAYFNCVDYISKLVDINLTLADGFKSSVQFLEQ